MAKKGGTKRRFDPVFKLRVVRTALEKKISISEVARLFELDKPTVYSWKRAFEEKGEAAFAQTGRKGKSTVPTPLESKFRGHVLEVKKEHPYFGVGRVWHWLRRTLFLPIPIRFVQRTLAEENLLIPVRKRRKYAPRVRRFERTSPNHLWQSDITAFQIGGGLKVYLIGFLDDYSRFVVGWGLYAGQSGALVLEVLRRAMALYGRPKQMLTDNGRQYASWHGKTDFVKELLREGIEHLRSRPHHPATLGKIEAFWGHLKAEFVRQAPLGDLESVRQRLIHWIAYYNFQRPHAGIHNSTPAERFFQFDQQARAEIERRIQANERELAFAAGDPSPVVGQGSLGVQIRKEGTDFKVYLDGQELRKEVGDEAQDRSAGEGRPDGGGGQGEGGPGPSGPLGGEVDRGGMPGDGAEGTGVLQAGGAAGGGDAGGGEDARGPQGAPPEGSGGGGEPSGAGDPGTPAGAPADVGARTDLQETLPDPGAGRQKGARTASEGEGGGPGPLDAGGNGAASGVPAAGPAAVDPERSSP